MVPRWARISYVVFGLSFIALGILQLTRGDETGPGVVQLMLGAGWLMVAAFKGRRMASQAKPERGTTGSS